MSIGDPVGLTATRWTAGENKWKQNLSSPTSASATSLSTGNAGVNGTDIAYCIRLSATRFLWLFGDSWWNTAAGQTRLGGRLVSNLVALQVGSNFSTSTLTFHCGARPGLPASAPSNTDPWPYFPHDAMPLLDVGHGVPGAFKYPLCGIRL